MAAVNALTTLAASGYSLSDFPFDLLAGIAIIAFVLAIPFVIASFWEH